jgi:hypothetical protein
LYIRPFMIATRGVIANPSDNYNLWLSYLLQSLIIPEK